jgi:hypothetical protein
MFKSIALSLIIVFLPCVSISAQQQRNIEIFDIKQGKVVKVLKSNSHIQRIATSYLRGIKGIYGKFDPIPTKGYAIRIPMEPSVNVEVKGVSTEVAEIFVMFPENEEPFLMFFEKENTLVCFVFEGDTELLLKKLKYSPINDQG